MNRFVILFFIVLFGLSNGVSGENLLLDGGQSSEIDYQMTQHVKPSENVRRLMLSFVVPEPFETPTFRQEIDDVDFNFSPKPKKRTQTVNQRGNKIILAEWDAPLSPIVTRIHIKAKNIVKLSKLETSAPFPPVTLPEEVKVYLASTQQVPADDARIRAKAEELTASAKTQFDAVQQVMTWIIDHLQYVLNPKQYDALYSMESHKGNCQNYSHLAAALLRSVGIPVRIVNGITLKKPYDIAVGGSILTMRMAQGRHSWVEVYFPDLGWIPFDAQGTILFVSNRFIRVEIGLDNEETKNDGLIRWTRNQGSTQIPYFEEIISADFRADTIDISGRKMDYGPRELLLSPEVAAVFVKSTPKPPPPPPEKVPEKDLKELTYTIPVTFGNLEFPRNVDFISARGPAEDIGGDAMEMRKNFLVETAEYVTTQGKQYAQTFLLRNPIKLEKVGLALHKFSNEGQLWIELFEDDNGKPGKYIATSEIILVKDIPYVPGYDWIDFGFPSLKLSPGRYWVALGFTDSPIINWFFTYGKPVGPADGTRYKLIFDTTWSRSLSFEFNYRVAGLAPE